MIEFYEVVELKYLYLGQGFQYIINFLSYFNEKINCLKKKGVNTCSHNLIRKFFDLILIMRIKLIVNIM